MTTTLTVVGNSGFARECYIIIRTLMEREPNLHFNGFLSFEGYQASLHELSNLFLGMDDAHEFKPDEYAILAIGDPKIRWQAYTKLKMRGIRFYNLVHPDVYMDKTLELGEANIITSGCYISCNCRIGHANVLNGAVHVAHDVCIGDGNFIAPGVQFGGNVRMGNGNSVGTLCALLPHCVIGDNNTIAPCSAVYKGCRDNSYMIGNPAHRAGTVWSLNREQ